MKAEPAAPVATASLVTPGMGGAGLMVRLSVAVPVPDKLAAVIVTENVPVALGVPEIRPDDVLTLKPEGSTEAL